MQPELTRTHARPSAAGVPRAGFTLVELLVVISIVALVLGIGLGAMSRFDMTDRVALSEVQNALRSAHNWAIAREAPARVVLDKPTRSLRVEALEVVGTWHFEPAPKDWPGAGQGDTRELLGAFGLSGSRFGGRFVEDGYQGRALSFAGEPYRSHVDLHVKTESSYDVSRGFALRCAVRHAGHAGGALLDAGGSFGIETTDDGAVKCWIAPADTDEKGVTRRGGRVPLATAPGILVPERWATVELSYDGRRLVLLVDEQPLAEVGETASVSKLAGPIVLSPAETPFPGAIDNLSIAVVVAQESVELPKNVTFASSTPAEVVFSAGGGLDRARHRDPLEFGLQFEDGRTATLRVNLYGTVE